MKRNIFGLLTLIATLLCTACFDDDSTGILQNINDIQISGIEETYECTAFIGESLNIIPVINGYSENDLKFVWTLYNGQTGKPDSDGNIIEPTIIGTEKQLSYPVNLSMGSYTLCLTVTSKDNNYSVSKLINLSVSTEFSQGFYVLKENEEGNSDLDLLTIKGEIASDILSKISGAVKGKPRNLSINYGHFYINTDNDQIESTHTLTITTEDNEIATYRSSDLKLLFDRSNTLYDEMESDEKPYAILRSNTHSIYISSKGIRQIMADNLYIQMGLMPKNTGRFGFPAIETGGSPFIIYDHSSYGGYYYWDEINKSFWTGYMMGQGFAPLTKADGSGSELTQNLQNYKCLACGMNSYNSPNGYFIMEDESTGQRYVYIVKSLTAMAQYFSDRVILKNNSHMAQANSFSVNGLSAKFIYCLDNGNVYACNLNSPDYAETELSFEGIPAGEEITYITNQYWNAMMSDTKSNFNYLIVGTQNGDSYHVYMYNTVGGLPDGTPVKTIKGKGKLKNVRFLFGSGKFDENDLTSGQMYPIGD
ncbi:MULTISPECIES: PKD-like family lipoprotein [unclassified Butyricimonas]|uniref:PKD-like family lipoprotein n=1 Tax=unclassified Butyricimonas TaxID=2637652 RepID=UPI000C08B76F|nr:MULTISPECIES: PKD-like family lipoprotein [unclassified Butyricimonas]